jgi:hypothetical protein
VFLTLGDSRKKEAMDQALATIYFYEKRLATYWLFDLNLVTGDVTEKETPVF